MMARKAVGAVKSAPSEIKDEATAMPAVEAGLAAVVETTHEIVAGAVACLKNTQTETKATMDKTIKSAEEITAFGQANVEAFLKSGQIWAAGVQDLGKTIAATAQAQIEATMSSFKALTGVKSFKEVVDLQSSKARTSLEAAVAETGKLADASLKLAEEALAPITARVNVAVEKFGRAA